MSFSFHKRESKYFLKFGYSEKATKFEKNFYLKFDVTELTSGSFFQILWPSQNIRTLKKGLNFECQTRKLHNSEPHKRAVFVNCVGVKAASRRKVKHFSPCPSLADRMPRMPHLYNILEQLALSACCLLCWSSLNWFMWFLGRATCQVMDHCFWTELSVCQSSLCGLALAISVLWYI